MAVLIPDAIARPTSKTPAVKEKAIRELLPRVLRWLKQGGDTDEESEPESIVRDLLGALNGWNDGYQAARDLERSGWSPDSELVEILDGFSTYNAEQEAVKAWAKEVQPKPQFKLGDRVVSKQHGDISGEIVKIFKDVARYLVKGEGHVAEGEVGTHGTYVNWEDAQQCEQKPSGT